ncbi:MAG: chlororespiratory reduction 6 domain-containing protein [Candidatus Rokuibacteriota bacterium]
MIDPLVVVVGRSDVEAGDIQPTLRILFRLLADAVTVREYRERVDMAFQGYDADPRELFEIPEVRRFVAALDDAFPYWLYFLSREYMGLQAIAFCFLPPYLTEDAQRQIWPQRLTELVERRWAPALAELAAKAGWAAADIDELLATAGHYFLEGPRRGFDLGSV